VIEAPSPPTQSEGLAWPVRRAGTFSRPLHVRRDQLDQWHRQSIGKKAPRDPRVLGHCEARHVLRALSILDAIPPFAFRSNCARLYSLHRLNEPSPTRKSGGGSQGPVRIAWQ